MNCPDPQPKTAMSNNPNFRRTNRSLPIALLRAREVVMRPIRDMLATSGVNEQKWRVLRVLQENGPMELGEVAEAAVLLLSSLTRMVGPMQAEGLITRHTPREDRRKTVIQITPRAEDLIRAHAANSAQIFAQLEGEFGAQKLETLLDLLDDLRRLDLRSRR